MSKGKPEWLDNGADFWKTRVKPKLELIAGWARNGLSDLQIARNLGISKATLKKYIEIHPELSDILLDGRENAEILVENALFRRAVGYSYKEVTKERQKIYDENNRWTGEYELVVVKSVLKTMAPDVQAIVYWLEHRAPKKWKKMITEEEEPIEITIKRKTWENDEDEDDDS